MAPRVGGHEYETLEAIDLHIRLPTLGRVG